MGNFLIIDDHPLFRDALRAAILTNSPNARVVDAANVVEAEQILSEGSDFDLALLDLNIPGVKGFAGLLSLGTNYPKLPIVVVSGHEESKVIDEAIAYGAIGYIPKSVKSDELMNAIRLVMAGEIYLPENYKANVGNEVDEDRKRTIEKLSSLTPQQLRVLNMLRDGLLNKQIAYELGVGERTVKAHVSEILHKLEVLSRTQAVIEASKLDADAMRELEMKTFREDDV
jgi:DNA-binding NarL/FixJ family response regulator